MNENKLYQITREAPGVFRIMESGLAAIYLVVGTSRALLVDTGVGIGDLKAVVSSLTKLPYDVVLTHTHRDHAGGSGMFERIYVHPDERADLELLTPEYRMEYVAKMAEVNAFDKALMPYVDIHEFPSKPEVLRLTEETVFDLGDRVFSVMTVPGHTEADICLYDRKNKVLFSGDMANPIMLPRKKADSQNGRLCNWLKALDEVIRILPSDVVICGGHGMLTLSVFNELERIGNLYLDGKLQPVRKKVHFFDDEMLVGNDVYIVMCPLS